MMIGNMRMPSANPPASTENVRVVATSTPKMKTPARIEGSPLRIFAQKRISRALLEPCEYSVR